MHRYSNIKKHLCIGLSALLLVACGGGGGGSTENTSNTGTGTGTGTGTSTPTFESLAGHTGKCVVDNTNNLVWEVKQTSGLHKKEHTYYWYNPSAPAGKQGRADNGSTLLCESSARCDTDKFVKDVNAASWCGFDDWRLPTKAELEKLLDNSKTPKINTTFFPNTVTSFYWTSDNRKFADVFFATAVNFSTGSTQEQTPNDSHLYVRLVRNK